MGYSTVVFDLDGTLLDTLDDLWRAVNVALDKFSFPLRTREEVRSFVGNGVKMLIGRAIGEIAHPKIEEVLSEFKAYYAAHCKENTRPYDGILTILKTLKERGIKTAVLSNKSDFATKELVKEYFGTLIERAAGENEDAGIRKKPAPDALWNTLEELGSSREETVYVGDSEVDIQTAQNAGVDCISVTWGFKKEEFLRENGATCLIDEPVKLLPFFGLEK